MQNHQSSSSKSSQILCQRWQKTLEKITKQNKNPSNGQDPAPMHKKPVVCFHHLKRNLGGGFQYFYFHPYLGK